MVRHTNFQYQAAKQAVLYTKNSWKRMRPEARPIEFTNGLWEEKVLKIILI